MASSFVMNADGDGRAARAGVSEGLRRRWTFVRDGRAVRRCAPASRGAASRRDEASVYGALVRGVRDYVRKHRFPGVVLGLSGGVDSALTLAIAVDALGADRVHAVMMPSRYTSQMSSTTRPSRRAARRALHVIPIEGMFEATLARSRTCSPGRKPDTTEENIQSRCRGCC
jgi:NAD+ synthase (glutamine-hydrolysing)